MILYSLLGAANYSTVISDVEMDSTPLHLLAGLKAIPRQNSLLDADEVSGAYDAISFSMYKYGVVTNTHLTFEWNKLGISDPSRAVGILSQFNSDTAKWLRVGKPRSNLQRIGRRQGRNAEHFYVNAHENGSVHGFHTHQICYIPTETIAEFRSWAWRRIAQLTACSGDTKGALDIKAWKSKSEDEQIKRGWSAFRYIIKQLSPDVGVYDNEGRVIAARDIFKPWPVRHLRPVNYRRVVSWSHNIGCATRRKANFASRYQRGNFDEMYSGFELEEGRKARQELQKCNELQEMMDTIQF